VKRAFEFLHNLASEERLESTVEIGISNNNNNNNSNNNAGCRIKSNEGCFDQNWGMDKTCFNYTDMNAFGLEEMTIEKCLDFCYNRGAADGEGIPRTQGERVKYIGLESGKSCWCSSRRVNGNETECGLENSKDCDTECTGDVDETCGGDWRMEVYKVDCDPPPTPPVSERSERALRKKRNYIRATAKLTFILNFLARSPPPCSIKNAHNLALLGADRLPAEHCQCVVHERQERRGQGQRIHFQLGCKVPGGWRLQDD